MVYEFYCIENIETVKVIDLENKLINSNNDNTCKQSINQYVHDLSEIFVDSSKKTLFEIYIAQ
jgi:hypothetical protein